MSYATQAHVVERYGERALLDLADRDDDDVADPGVIERALADATAEIDTYLATKYDLPLADTPLVLIRICVDIAVYRLSPKADIATEERRLRYEDAIKLLKDLASRTATLNLAGDTGEPLPRPRRVRTAAPERMFTGQGGALEAY